MSPLTTHVLNTATGHPAQGLHLRLQPPGGGPAIKAVTNADGRVADLLGPGGLVQGVWTMRFETGAWYASQGLETFYPHVEVVFEVRDGRHHHVPLLLSPHGYSTYRGS